MAYLVAKVMLTAVIVVAIAEIAKRSTLVGALIASLPLTSLLAFVWIYVETHDAEKVATLSSSIFWYVLPSLVLFVAFPHFIASGWNFWTSLAVSIGLTAAAYAIMLALLSRSGVSL